MSDEIVRDSVGAERPEFDPDDPNLTWDENGVLREMWVPHMNQKWKFLDCDKPGLVQIEIEDLDDPPA